MTLLVSELRINEIINHPQLEHNIGKFMMITKARSYVVVDNSTGEAWTKEFDCICKAADWLNENHEHKKPYEKPTLSLIELTPIYGELNKI